MKSIKAYGIDDIANFGGGNSGSIVLPKMQRGFVWRPAQILNLWDSILRGFPIGSIMLVEGNDKQMELLDGQQRCTSIIMGFYDQFGETNNGAFSLNNFPSIWVDARPGSVPVGNQFSLNLVTKAHPWGYEKREVGKVLSIADRMEALKVFQVKQSFSNYLEIHEQNRSPYDSHYPVPLAFLLALWNCSEEQFKTKLLDKLKNLSIITKYSEQKKITYEGLEEKDYSYLYHGLQNSKKLVIPEILVGAAKIHMEDPNQQDPTLFQRLNAGGTQLDGEELVYSIFKARYGRLKDLVEGVSSGFITPSKLVNIFVRLARLRWEREYNKTISYIKKVNVRTFNLWVDDTNYSIILENIVEEAKMILHNVLVLLQSLNEKEEIPGVLVKDIINRNTDFVFILLSYFDKEKITVEELSLKDRKNMLWLLYNHIFFSVDKDRTNKRIFEIMSSDLSNWSSILNKLTEEKFILKLLPPNILQQVYENLIDSKLNFNSDEFIHLLMKEKVVGDYFDLSEQQEIQRFKDFVHKASFQKELIILAQYTYIKREFAEFNELYDLEDTNKPWDWDHIFPKSWVNGPHHIDQRVKQWINCNGNFRLMTLSDNRRENNREAPKVRLGTADVRADFFVDEMDYKNFWGAMQTVPIHIKNINNDNFRIYLSAVLFRTCKIYKNWYDNFKSSTI